MARTTPKTTKYTQYLEDVIEWLVLALPTKEIRGLIREKGFTGSNKTIDNIISMARTSLATQSLTSPAEIIRRSYERHKKMLELALKAGKLKEAITIERSLLELARLLGPQAGLSDGDIDVVIE